MDDLVSVIVPTFNRAYCVGRAIDSVCAQTHAHWELLLVDDGSTDNTAELIAARYGHDPRIRYIYQQNAGVSAARNAGIRASMYGGRGNSPSSSPVFGASLKPVWFGQTLKRLTHQAMLWLPDTCGRCTRPIASFHRRMICFPPRAHFPI